MAHTLRFLNEDEVSVRERGEQSIWKVLECTWDNKSFLLTYCLLQKGGIIREYKTRERLPGGIWKATLISEERAYDK